MRPLDCGLRIGRKKRGRLNRSTAVLSGAFVFLVAVSCKTADQPAKSPSLQRQTSVEDAAAVGVGEIFTIPRMVTLDGRTIEPADLFKDRSGVVIAMTSTGCPMSRKYGPRLAAIEQEYLARPAGNAVAFVYVNTVEAETDQHMRAQARVYGFRGPYLPDRDRAVAAALGVRTTTEVFVLDRDSRLVYRGAVDDQYGIGTSLGAPRHTYLRDALDALLAGTAESLQVKATFAPGCLVDVPRRGIAGGVAASAIGRAASGLTYFERAAHMLADNCVECHTPGGVAPFSLATYPDIQGRASMIEAVVRDGLMPPSHGRVTSDVSEIASPRQMSDADRADLLAWLASDRAMGDFADGPPPKTATAEWAVGSGKPDLLYITPGLRLPVDGSLMHARSVLRLAHTEDQWVREVEFRPLKLDTVHHAFVWILPRGVGAPADDALPRGLELLGVYSPAQTVLRYQGGIARRLPAGCSLLVDLYAQPMGREMMASLRMAIALGDEPREEVRSLVVQEPGLRIAPGDGAAVGSAELVLAEDARVLAVTPYMRSRGKSLRLTASDVGGANNAKREGDSPARRGIVLDAPRYDYRWQFRYEFAEPRLLSAGTTLSLRAVYDNSAANANNPDPAATVRSGPGAADEALMAVLEVVVPVARHGQ